MNEFIASRTDPLTRAAIRHGSDKFGGHIYTPIYHQLFQHLREKSIRMLEIGIGGYDSPKAGGASLRMWAEYFPYAKIIGLDIEAKKIDISPRVKIIQGSQIDIDLLKKITGEHGPFDIIVDDGSHVVSHMIDSFICLYPLMASSGIYAIEDVQTSFSTNSGGNQSGAGTIFDLAHRVGLAMHILEGFIPTNQDEINSFGKITKSIALYRNQVIFHRGENTYPSNINLDFENSEVRSVYQTIINELALNPSSRSYLSVIDMLIWAGRQAEAARFAIEASNAYPDDEILHNELIRMMSWAGQAKAQELIVEKTTFIEQKNNSKT
ncbi:hypothetical protein ACOSOMT5_P2086 [Acidiphilium sp. MT5]